MNVVHIIVDLQQGGAEAMMEKLILSSGTHTPYVKHSVVSLLSLGVVGPRLLAAGIAVEALQLNDPRRASLGLFRLWRLMRSLPPGSVIQTWMYHAALVGGCLARLCGLRHVYWNMRAAVVQRSDYSRLTYGLIRICGWLSPLVPQRIVHCGAIVMESHVRLGYRRDKSVVIGNGFDLGRYHPDRAKAAPVRAELGLPPHALLIGTVARMDPAKDFPTLAHAAQRVCAELPAAHFLMVGPGVDTDVELQRLLQSLGIAERVTRLGLHSEIPRLLNALDIFCMSSMFEGFPNALGEAMACGLPCVTTAAGDAGFVIGAAEWTVPVGEPQTLADALVRMARLAPDERYRLGVHNRQRVEREFSIARSWSSYLRMYQQDVVPQLAV